MLAITVDINNECWSLLLWPLESHRVHPWGLGLNTSIVSGQMKAFEEAAGEPNQSYLLPMSVALIAMMSISCRLDKI